MDLIVSPTIVAFNSQSNAHPQALTPGQTLDALVMQLLDATNVRLSVAGTVVDLPSPIPLVPGAIVRLAVRGHGTETKFVIVGLSPRSPTEAGQKAAAGAATPAPANAATTVTIHEQPAPAATATGAAPGAAQATTDEAGAPSVVPDQAPAAAAVTPKARVVERPVSSDPTIALASAMRTSAPRQVGLTPLLADAAEAMISPHLPAPVRQALGQLLILPQSFATGVSAADIEKGLKQSGVLLEAHLADPRAPYTPAPDLKVALLNVRHALNDWVEQVPQLADPTAAETAASVAAAAVANIKSGIAAGRAAAAQASPPGAHAAEHAAAPAAVVKALPPPYRGAPTTGQGPAAASVESIAPLDAIRNTLIDHTEGALARMTLLQSASLGESAGPQQVRHEPSAPHWNFEIPYMAPAGTAVAHFEIARDGNNGAAVEAKSAVWRANFSIDIEPIGPVHAQVAVTGHHTSVRLWAERKAAATALREGSAELRQALAQASLEAAEVLVRDGVPPRPVKPPTGRFLDRAT